MYNFVAKERKEEMKVIKNLINMKCEYGNIL